MSFTQGEEVFAGVHEDAVNDMIKAISSARGKYLNYRSDVSTTAAVTQIPKIPVGPGIDWGMSLTVPKVDIYPQANPASPLPALAPGQFRLTTALILCIGPVFPIIPQICTPPIQLHVIGHIAYASPTEVILVADKVDIVPNPLPNPLDQIVETVLVFVANAILDDFKFPMTILTLPPFHATMGPFALNHTISVLGNE